MKHFIQSFKNNRSGFTFVELLVVIVIMAVLVAASANYLFAQGGSKARDAERKNEMKQVAALIEQFVASYGEPPNSNVRSRKIRGRVSECENVDNFKSLMACFNALDYVNGDGLLKLTEDPKEQIESDAGNVYQYLYGANNNGWKVCALLENQSDPDLNDSYSGTGSLGAEGQRTYCLVASNRDLDYIQSVNAGSDTSFLPN